MHLDIQTCRHDADLNGPPKRGIMQILKEGQMMVNINTKERHELQDYLKTNDGKY